MTTDDPNAKLEQALASDRPAGTMQPGESRTFHRKDGSAFTIHRTDRPYVHDLCDAYNAARSNLALLWVVEGGELRLLEDWQAMAKRTEQIARRRERERQEWKRRMDIDRPPAAPHWQDERDG
jgi:hypothetical protein